MESRKMVLINLLQGSNGETDLRKWREGRRERVRCKEKVTWKKDQFSSVAQSCPTLCDPMNHITPGLPVHHQLPEFTQTHVHRVSDAIQPSHPLSSPSPPAPNPPSIRVLSNESTLHIWLGLIQMCSILWLSDIPLYICPTASLSIHLSMDV